MELCFVSTRRGNHFMTELLSAVAAVAANQGASVSMVFDEFPEREDITYVVIPHEFFGAARPSSFPRVGQFRRTIAFCVEHPGTQWYELSSELAAHAGAVVDINRSAVEESRRRGIPAEHFQLGYFPSWDTWHRDEEPDRPIDVLYMGSFDQRRDRLLASYSNVLWRRRCSILVPPQAPTTGPAADYLVEGAKHQRMRESQLLLNLHRGDSRALEWVRVLEAMTNGCVVVSEHSRDHHPLVPGEHFVSAAPESVGVLADGLLDNPDVLDRLRLQAYDFIRSALPVMPAVERLLALAEDLVANNSATRPGDHIRFRPAVPGTPDESVPAENEGRVPVQTALKRLATDMTELRREVQSLRMPGETGPRVICESACFSVARPRVSVIVSLHNYETELSHALRSVNLSEFTDYELLVLDDASTDRSADAAVAFVEAHPWIPAKVLRSRVNRGPSATRNVLVAEARGELLFVLDADNGVYPSALGRLVDALDRDREASFAYPIIAVYGSEGPRELISSMAWNLDRLRMGNYIDAMALIRKERLLEIGGYGEDPRLAGLEDYDLWCRFADRGWYGTHVPEILAWYRWWGESLGAFGAIDTSTAYALIRARAGWLRTATEPFMACLD